jgi:hypothetical protein
MWHIEFVKTVPFLFLVGGYVVVQEMRHQFILKCGFLWYFLFSLIHFNSGVISSDIFLLLIGKLPEDRNGTTELQCFSLFSLYLADINGRYKNKSKKDSSNGK